MFSISITTATAEGFTADVLVTPKAGLNRAALRRLILDLAATELGTDNAGMRERGYDTSYFRDGWDAESRAVPGGRRLIQYDVRPLTEREQRAILRERGGFVDHGDGSMGFVLPQPRAKATPAPVQRPKVKHQR